MKSRLESLVNKADNALENASVESRLALAAGGAVVMIAGVALEVHGLEVEGFLTETAGATGIIAGAEPGVLRWMGLLPPRQSDESRVE